jgi:hypothetical protein
VGDAALYEKTWAGRQNIHQKAAFQSSRVSAKRIEAPESE